MAPTVSSAQSKLSYPLYAADFDPYNPDFLLVGGGGGSSSTGVPNKISLIDTSRRSQLTEVVDVELVSGEDSVTSLAVSDSSASSLTAFAGINSSIADQNAGKNEHLRSFRIGLPVKKRRADGTAVDGAEKPLSQPQSSQALGRTSLFRSASGTKNETYQRVLRFSPVKTLGQLGQPRIAAIASGLAPENEIVVFRPTPTPTQQDEISRINLGNREAADVDLNVNSGEKEGHVLAYCTDDEVFIQQLPASSKPASPTSLYRTTESTTSLPPSKRPKFRAVRFLSPRHLLLLQNRPGRTGADLLVLRVANDLSQSRISLRKRLHSSTKAAVGLDVCALTDASLAEYQIIIAVAGQSGDASSIELLTIDYSRDSGLGTFRPYTLLRNVHSGPLTRLVFSNFISPTLPVTKDTPPQSVRLASVGVDQTVVVHYLPLRPYPPSAKTPRYVLTPPGRSETMQTTFSVFVALVVVSLVAFMMQAFCEIRGVVPPVLRASDWLSPSMRNLVGRPYILADKLSSVAYSDVPVAAHSATQKVKEAVADVPVAAHSATQKVKEAVADVPVAAHSATQKVKEVASDVPIAADSATQKVKQIVPDVPDAAHSATQRIKDAVPDVPIAADSATQKVKEALSDVPDAAHSATEKVKEVVSDFPSDVANAASNLRQKLEDLVQENSRLETPKAIIVREANVGELSTEVADDVELVKRETLKKWEDLSETQKKSWKQKLIDAGYWAEKQGENLLQGIFFSELAGAVGNLVGGGQ